jgi:tRNA(fMet)-specific endonuclease VapC
VIDTSVCIEIERRGQIDLDLARLALNEPVDVTTITTAELPIGAELGRTAAIRQRSSRLTENLLGRVDVYAFDLAAARTYAQISVALQSTGLRIGGFDLQIASIAIVHDCSVVTLNLRDFNRVPGLTVIAPDW